jgi:dihydroneopterin aldolase
MDKVFLRGVHLRTHIGVTQEERQQWQTINVDIEMGINLKLASIKDDIEKTIDYVEVRNIVKKVAEQNECCLLEKLANDMIESLCHSFSLHWIQIRLSKPNILSETDCVGIQLERECG